MTVTIPRIFMAIRTLFRQDREVILTLAGMFVFLPALAVRLLTDPIPMPAEAPGGEAAVRAWFEAVTVWGQANAGWHVAADGVALIGLGAIAMVLVAPGRPDVRSALVLTLGRFPRLVLASILASLAINAGMWMLLIPGLWIQARVIAILPVLAAEPRRSATGAIGRSVTLTRGQGIALLGAVAALFLAQWLMASPLEALDRYLREPDHLNPFVLAMVDAALAAVGTAWRVALLLGGVAIYRARASIGT